MNKAKRHCEIKVSVPKINGYREIFKVKPTADVFIDKANAVEIAMLAISFDKVKEELLKDKEVREAYNVLNIIPGYSFSREDL